jgi:ethanolamine kinase
MAAMVAVIDAFSMCANLFWGLWAVVQTKYSSIDFDFAGYGRRRMDAYFALKRRVTASFDVACIAPPGGL